MIENPGLTGKQKAAKRLSSILKDVTAAASKSLPDSESPLQDSPSALQKLYKEAAERDVSEHVAESLRYAERSFLSACDHANTFATLIRLDARPSTSLVTITRGALEAASRSWWITEDVPLDTFLHRVISMRWDDLKFARKFPDSLESISGDTTPDAERVRVAYVKLLEKHGLPKPKPEGNSALVKKLLIETTPLDSPEMAYSVYSSIAHSQLSGLDSFAAPNKFGPQTRFEVPLPVLTSLTIQMVFSLLSVAERLSIWAGGKSTPLDRLTAARQRACEVLSTIPSSAYTSTPPSSKHD